MLRLLPIRFRAVALAVSFAACSSKPPEQAVAPVATTVPNECRNDCSNGIQDAVDTDPDPLEAITELTLPPAACVLATERWNGKELVTELRLSTGGPVYALFTQPHARLHLAAGPSSAGAAVEVEDGGVVLRGFLKSDAFTLHPAKPLVLGGFAIPSAFAVLSWTEAREGQVSIGYDIGPGVEGLLAPLGASVPCSDLTIDFASFEPTDALEDVSNAKDAQLHLGHSIDLRAQPGGKVVARLRAKDDDDSLVKVLRSSGRSKRILWWRDTAVVFGWVAASELRPRSVGLTGYGTGHGGPVLPRSSAILKVVRCDRDVALFAEAQGQRAKVGSVKRGTVLEILSRDHDFGTVQPQSKSIAAAPNAKLLASAHELASCGPVGNDG